MALPPFPVDDATLDMLWLAMHPGPDAESSSLGSLLRFYSELGGSDVHAVEEVVDDGEFGPAIHVMRDQQYEEHAVISALITEIRRLRANTPVVDTTGDSE